MKRLVQLQRLTIAPSQQVNQQIRLTSDQQHYLGRVLRLQPCDRFIAMDGQGHWWLAELNETLLEASILNTISIQTELPIGVVLLVAMPKGNGMDDLVRQVTELGTTEIVPIISDRTLLNPSAQKVERWQRIAQEAAEQSERQIIPGIQPPISFAAALTRWNANTSTCYLCETRGTYPHLLSCVSAHLPPSVSPSSCLPLPPGILNSSIVVATGPEGGWTEPEIDAAIAAGYQPVSLGQRVLRAITAPIVAMSIIASALEMMPQSNQTV